ncbi:mitochondrial import receptor subunit TOM70-like [Diabrotica virgifera virgifera]|uniref:Mitochondrial import receptor subunit TOM70-like n=1 Tax=Diabrotica virgifera virgifera TaxID=50390 RepID=A0A6P7FDN0_DIAVI|nr:mitochondrial import receptor subunit TOM70-like [Diabrotica virgifera virgifera]
MPSLKWQIAFGLGAAGALGLAYWYLRASKKETLQTLNAAIENDKENTPFQEAQKYKTQGNEFFKRGKYDEAIACYNSAIETIPEEHKLDLATYYQNRAAAYEQLKKWSSVISDCTKAIELNNRYEKALFRRAKAEEMLKDWVNALDDITTVCLLQNFQNQATMLMADRVLKELGKQNAAEAIKNRIPVIPSRSFIKTYFSSFSEDPVFKKLQEISEPLGLGDLKGFLKAKLAFATERYDEVISACTEELNLSESESQYKFEALSLRASFYFLTGQFKEALEDLTFIIDSKEADLLIKVNSLIKRSSIYMQTEKIQDCLADFEAAAELGPEVSDVFHHRGQVKLLMEQIEDARKDFEKAVALNPDFAVAVVQKCYADYRYAMQVKDVTLLMQTMHDFRMAIERFPNCAETYVLFAQVKTEKQEFHEAEKLYQTAMEIDPHNASIYVHRGLLLLQWKGEIENAVELMKEAVKVDDKSEFAYETLGTVEVQRGNLVLAIELFNKAIALARSEMEMVHLFSLRDAASSQLKIASKMGLGPDILKGVS